MNVFFEIPGLNVYMQIFFTLLSGVLLHGALNGFNAFFERSLFPALAGEDGFVIFFILLTLIAGIAAAILVRRIAVRRAEMA